MQSKPLSKLQQKKLQLKKEIKTIFNNINDKKMAERPPPGEENIETPNSAHSEKIQQIRKEQDFFQKYDLTETLGSGTNGVVKLCIQKETQ